MFRQIEAVAGGWNEMTIDAMQRRRFKQMVLRLSPLGVSRLNELNYGAFERRIEQSWQDFERKPIRKLQMEEIWRTVLKTIDEQADYLSNEEHSLVERALVLGGSARIEDIAEMEAASALSLRLWASIGLVSGRPYLELEPQIIRPVAKAFARSEHEEIRKKLEDFRADLNSVLYRTGILDDRYPQQIMIREVMGGKDSELNRQLARRYLWASHDCIDYQAGVMLVHSAVADPSRLIRRSCSKKDMYPLIHNPAWIRCADILPEEIPLQTMLEMLINGALRDGYRAQDVVRTIRFICKQGAPLSAMADVLQESLIIHVTPAMRCALREMYYRIPKWIESTEETTFQ